MIVRRANTAPFAVDSLNMQADPATIGSAVPAWRLSHR
jgi:hypothetical protein